MKNESDIFICKLQKDDYWAYPSPFVAHGGGFEIQFRNLTDEAIEIDLGDAPVHKQRLSLAPRAADYVIVNGDAVAGLHEYRAVVAPAAVRKPPAHAAAGRARGAAPSRKARPILVKGGSPPKIIIDT